MPRRTARSQSWTLPKEMDPKRGKIAAPTVTCGTRFLRYTGTKMCLGTRRP